MQQIKQPTQQRKRILLRRTSLRTTPRLSTQINYHRATEQTRPDKFDNCSSYQKKNK